MHKHSAAERQFLLSTARAIVAQIAAEELVIFADLAQEYFDDPSPPSASSRWSDDPLGAGLSEDLFPVTPAAMAASAAALHYIQQVTAASGMHSVVPPSPMAIQHILRNTEQCETLRLRVYETARTFRVPEDTAAHLTNEFITLLLQVVADNPPPQRSINAWIAGQRADQALELHTTYHLNVQVDFPSAELLASMPGIDELTMSMAPDQEMIDIEVLLETEDFLIHPTATNILQLPRSGPSNCLQFPCTTQRAGLCSIIASFIINAQLFQKMHITIPVGAAESGSVTFRTRSSGLTTTSALHYPALRPRIELDIEEHHEGYTLRIRGESGVLQRALIRISQAKISDLVEIARTTLHEIVYTELDKKRVYQQADTTIPAAVYEQSLQPLADLGRYLYNELFYNGRGAEARETGDLLRALMQNHQFDVRVVADQFVFPWALLYHNDDLTTVDPQGFWGFRHMIACIPWFSQVGLAHCVPQISVGERLHIGFVYDSKLDQHISAGSGVVQQQRQFFQNLPGIEMTEYPDRQSLFALLKNPLAAPHIIYFYCHAQSYTPGGILFSPETRVTAQSQLELTDGHISLLDMERQAPTRLPPWLHAPLIFLNACNSARLSPYFYIGFVPYMIARGARGVLGTEVETPTYFAAEFAQELFTRLNKANTALGEVLLDVRRSYLLQKRNILGLLYTLHASNDIAIHRWRK